MKAPLPPNFTPPFWATRNFRLLLGAGLMGLAVMGVMVFQIGPALNQRPVRQKQADPNAFVPKPVVAGEAREVKYEGVLDRVKDGSSIDDQEQPYQYLIRALSRMEPAQLSKDAKSVDYGYYSKMPVEMRGETVKILALFLQSNPIRVDGAPGGVQFIHRTYLSDLSGAEGYVVDLLEPPGELASRTLVGLEAVFFKLGTYEGKKGPVQAPLFVGKSLRTVKERMAGGPVANLSGGMILGVAVALLFLMIFLTSRIFKKAKPPAPKGPALSMETLKT
jgi:hypothetical protein